MRKLGKISGNPTLQRWRNLQHLLRCISGIKRYGVLFEDQKDETIDLIGYSDEDFAGDSNTQKSCTGSVIKLGTVVIDRASRTQRTIAISTTEAEWPALHEGVRHGEYIRDLLDELNFYRDKVKWWCDNKAKL